MLHIFQIPLYIIFIIIFFQKQFRREASHPGKITILGQCPGELKHGSCDQCSGVKSYTIRPWIQSKTGKLDSSKVKMPFISCFYCLFNLKNWMKGIGDLFPVDPYPTWKHISVFIIQKSTIHFLLEYKYVHSYQCSPVSSSTFYTYTTFFY